ncbi:BnaAnng34200D [Brassica napus]|uniref:BnaAnng34200D protein n=1 Tax=Brassica napus TaxID=3708 RepID=A0A078JUS6_BRANA|nr:BnaAnng34200D [Brassica napus]
MTKKIDQNTDGLLKLNMISFTIPILFSHKLGINRYGSTVSVAADNLAAHTSGSAENRTVEKTAFDVKLEKFEAASKIKAMRIQDARRSRQFAHRIHRTHL